MPSRQIKSQFKPKSKSKSKIVPLILLFKEACIADLVTRMCRIVAAEIFSVEPEVSGMVAAELVLTKYSVPRKYEWSSGEFESLTMGLCGTMVKMTGGGLKRERCRDIFRHHFREKMAMSNIDSTGGAGEKCGVTRRLIIYRG